MSKVKAVILSVFFLVLFVTTKSNATDYSWVLAGSQGYLSSSSSVSTFFYGKSGTTIAILGYPSNTSLKGYCGLVSIGSSSTLLAQGYTSSYTTATLSSSDLYIVACVKASGTSDNMLIGVADYNKLSTAASSSNSPSKAPENDPPQEVIDRLNEAIQKILH